MFCKWCGLESTTTDFCSWCRRPFASPGPSATATSAPSAASASLDDIDDDLTLSPFSSASFRVSPPSATTPLPPTPPPPLPAPAPPPPVAKTLPVAAPEPPVVAKEAPSSSPVSKPVPIVPAEPVAEAKPVPLPSPPAPVAPPLEPAPSHPAFDLSEPDLPPLRPITPPAVSPKPAPPPQDAGLPLAAIPIRSPGKPVAAPSPIAPAPPPAAPPPPKAPPPPLRPLAPLGEQFEAEEPEPTIVMRNEPPPAPSPVVPRAFSQEPEDDGFAVAPPMPRYEIPSTPAPPGPLTGMPPASTGRSMGRTWLCRWCGMESEAPDFCTWCRKDLRASAPAASSGKGPVITTARGGKGGSKRGPVRQPVVRQPAPAPRPAPARTGAATAQPSPKAASAPALGTFQAQKSKYYSDKVLDPVSGAHYDVDTGKAEEKPEFVNMPVRNEEMVSELKVAAVFLGALLVFTGLLAGIAYGAPSFHLALLAAGNFVAGLAMTAGPLKVVPYMSEEAEDMGIALPFMLLLGPIVGGAFYIIKMVIAQTGNPAFLGMFISYFVLRIPLDLAADAPLVFKSFLPFTMPPAGSDWPHHLAGLYCIFAGFLGWMCADSFRKTDE